MAQGIFSILDILIETKGSGFRTHGNPGHHGQEEKLHGTVGIGNYEKDHKQSVYEEYEVRGLVFMVSGSTKVCRTRQSRNMHFK